MAFLVSFFFLILEQLNPMYCISKLEGISQRELTEQKVKGEAEVGVFCIRKNTSCWEVRI